MSNLRCTVTAKVLGLCCIATVNGAACVRDVLHGIVCFDCLVRVVLQAFLL